jgi:hypothetical protein
MTYQRVAGSIAAGAVLLTLCAFAWHNVVGRTRWPLRWF